MKAAILNSMIGIMLSFLVGYKILDSSLFDTFLSIIGANCAGLVSLLFTLQLEKFADKFERNYLKGNLRIWSFLLLTYSTVLVCLSPSIREFRSFILLFIPLLLSSGFSLIVFGSIQDRLVWREQKSQQQHKQQKI